MSRSFIIALFISILLSGAASAQSLTNEPNIDYPGNDYNSFVPSEANAEVCRTACSRETRCKSYTFVRPRAADPRGKCYLKTVAENRRTDSCCISGKREGASLVNLAPNQTELREQEDRTSCITFSALAALEAAYARTGIRNLDLSEQFLNHFGKMVWLHHDWAKALSNGPDGAEGQVGAFSGGNGGAYIEQLSKGTRVPEERYMPYRSTEYTSADHPGLSNAFDSAFFQNQKAMNDFNLDSRFLPRSALTAPKYYSVSRFERANATDPRALEQVLRSGHEVVWDFMVPKQFDANGNEINAKGRFIWKACPANRSDCVSGPHSMLLIGYDTRDADPAKHHFIAKNSWERTLHPDGYTRISYDVIRKHGLTAAYITQVTPPSPWPELAFIGRWNLNFDGHTGLLDIYHLPGIAQWHLDEMGVRVTDRRIGSFYDASGVAHRVNGRVLADRIEFYIDGRNRMARWDQLGDRHFTYGKPRGSLMSGMHRDPDGREYGGYARLGGLLPAGQSVRRPLSAQSYLGTWKTDFLGPRTISFGSGSIQLTRLDNNAISDDERREYDALVGEFTWAAGAHTPVVILVSKRDRNLIELRLRPASGRTVSAVGRLLNHTSGVIASSDVILVKR